MIPFIIVRKILLSLAPLIIFYLLRKMGKKSFDPAQGGQGKQPKRKSHLSGFDPSADLRASKSQIIDGEIVEERK